MNRPAPCRARGFSLIELMVAVTIGLVLTMLIGQIFINSRQVFASTDSLSRLQESSRFATAILTRSIRLASYKSDPRNPRNYNVATLQPGVFGLTAAGQLPSLTGLDGGTTGTPTTALSDILTVRFQGAGNGTGTPDRTVQDCTGTPIDAQAMGTFITNTFFIQNDPANNNEPTLYCSTATPVAGVPPACTATTCFPLVAGVENMQIMYGEDQIGPSGSLSPDGSIDRFVPAQTNPTNTNPAVVNFENVISVRIALLIRTSDRVAATVTPANTAFVLLGNNVRNAAADQRLRRVFTTVIDLRNRSQ